MKNGVILNFPYEVRHINSFTVIGFSKIVFSGGEVYHEIYQHDKWQLLQNMNEKNQTIYGVASLDKECFKDTYRYTMGVCYDENFTNLSEETLYSIRIEESDWVVFTLNFDVEYRSFWENDPYKMIQELGYSYHHKLGVHIDVYQKDYTGGKMEFWMPVMKK